MKDLIMLWRNERILPSEAKRLYEATAAHMRENKWDVSDVELKALFALLRSGSANRAKNLLDVVDKFLRSV